MSDARPVMDRASAIAELTAPGQPYELEAVELYGRECLAFRQAPPTLPPPQNAPPPPPPEARANPASLHFYSIFYLVL